MMTPKQKAEELVNKYFNLPLCESAEAAKYAANICVEEIIETGVFWNDKQMVLDYPQNFEITSTYEFWQKVQIEIKKI